MPLNASSQTVVRLAAGQTRKVFQPDGQAFPATIRARGLFDENNPSGAVASVFTVGTAEAGRNSEYVLAVASVTAGTCTLTVDGVTTAAITYSTDDAVFATNIAAALAAIGISSSAVRVVASATDTINIVFLDSPGGIQNSNSQYNGYSRRRVVVTADLSSLSGGSPTITEQTPVGAVPGAVPVTLRTPDGAASGVTNHTVAAGGVAVFSYGGVGDGDGDADDYNLLGPYVEIACTQGEVELEISAPYNIQHLQSH
jgi:hypothetical protein